MKKILLILVTLAFLVSACPAKKKESAEKKDKKEKPRPQLPIMEEFNVEDQKRLSQFEYPEKELIISIYSESKEGNTALDLEFSADGLGYVSDGAVDFTMDETNNPAEGENCAKISFNPVKSGERLDFSYFSFQPLDLSSFLKGHIHFMFKGEKGKVYDYWLLAKGGEQLANGQTAVSQIIGTGKWDKVIIPLFPMRKMVSGGFNLATMVDFRKITTPMMITCRDNKPSTFYIDDFYISSRTPDEKEDYRRFKVDFTDKKQDWDGFGVNYVESAYGHDYYNEPEDYGGLSTLPEEKKQEVLDLIFGKDGLKPSLLKMFLDPFHEKENDNDDPYTINKEGFDHKLTTENMRYFVQGGLKRTREQGRDLRVITTMYGPPAWVTKQKVQRGRDLDPDMKLELAEYFASWCKFLLEEENIPLEFLSIHNEGDSPQRWDEKGFSREGERHDHNMFWPPDELAEYIPLLAEYLEKMDLGQIKITPGEFNIWPHYSGSLKPHHYYAEALLETPGAMENLGLITSHSFWSPTDYGVNLLKHKKPSLKAWTVSMTVGKGKYADVSFLECIRKEIHRVGVSGIIVWSITFQKTKWTPKYVFPGTTIYMAGDGTYRVEPAYYYYKHLTRLGQAGMAVASCGSTLPHVRIVAFASNGTENPDGLCIYNLEDTTEKIDLELSGTAAKDFKAVYTNKKEFYQEFTDFEYKDGKLSFSLPPYTAISFQAVK